MAEDTFLFPHPPQKDLTQNILAHFQGLNEMDLLFYMRVYFIIKNNFGISCQFQDCSVLDIVT